MASAISRSGSGRSIVPVQTRSPEGGHCWALGQLAYSKHHPPNLTLFDQRRCRYASLQNLGDRLSDLRIYGIARTRAFRNSRRLITAPEAKDRAS